MCVCVCDCARMCVLVPLCVCVCVRACVCVCVRGDKWRMLNVENTLLIGLGVGNADFFLFR